MKPNRSKVVILAIALTAVCSWAGYAENLNIRNCTWCHGISAQGLPPAPQLAGQQRRYLENQLRDFGHHTRDNPYSQQYMWSVGENLSPERVHDLATYFSLLPPRAANDGDQGLAALGRTIYQIGMPESNIVACVVCHGPNGEGVGEIPRLGGLGYTYLKRRLETWGEGFHTSAKLPMASVASKLSPNQIDALASYLSFLE
jgi:cytochrome c553